MNSGHLTTEEINSSSRIATTNTSNLTNQTATYTKAVATSTNPTGTITDLSTEYEVNNTLPQLTAYPNPASTQLFIRTTGLTSQKGQLTLFNQFGFGDRFRFSIKGKIKYCPQSPYFKSPKMANCLLSHPEKIPLTPVSSHRQ